MLNHFSVPSVSINVLNTSGCTRSIGFIIPFRSNHAAMFEIISTMLCSVMSWTPTLSNGLDIATPTCPPVPFGSIAGQTLPYYTCGILVFSIPLILLSQRLTDQPDMVTWTNEPCQLRWGNV